MMTTIYMVRHAESPYTEGTERTRGLTTKGKSDVEEAGKRIGPAKPHLAAIAIHSKGRHVQKDSFCKRGQMSNRPHPVASLSNHVLIA